MEYPRASVAPLQRQATTNEECVAKNKIRKDPGEKKSKAHAVAAVASPPSAGIVP